MAINGRFRVSMEDVFPAGAYVVGEVEAVRDFEKSTPERFAQARDKETGELLWSVPVLDADESAPKNAKTVVVKISAPRAAGTSGGGGRTAVPAGGIEGLTVTPYLDDKRNRVTYSLRARAMCSPAARIAGPGKPTSADGKAA